MLLAQPWSHSGLKLPTSILSPMSEKKNNGKITGKFIQYPENIFVQTNEMSIKFEINKQHVNLVEFPNPSAISCPAPANKINKFCWLSIISQSTYLLVSNAYV